MKFLIYTFSVILILGLVYFFGPHPNIPSLKHRKATLTDSLTILENEINKSEKATFGIKKDNEAKIVWADSLHKSKTKYAFVYLHGFSASEKEGDPVHRNIAKHFNANLYLARLQGHGLDLGDSTMLNVSADGFYQSAYDAVEIGKKLGDTVIVIATSFGAALALRLASEDPTIHALVTYSPCIKIFDPRAVLLDDRWGLQLARTIKGDRFMDIPQVSPDQDDYWSLHYRIEALVELQNFITNSNTVETFQKVKCPIMVGYYYKNETEQDSVVSVAAIKEMFDELGTEKDKKLLIDFPNAGHHVLGSYVLSKDIDAVTRESISFLEKVVGLKQEIQ
ncbi:MAG: alpha/beta hydrolase [Saprospiraceae bacterium]|nr:alpha/beta hydrolase [Saprospiraceae bacterium]